MRTRPADPAAQRVVDASGSRQYRSMHRYILGLGSLVLVGIGLVVLPTVARADPISECSVTATHALAEVDDCLATQLGVVESVMSFL